MSNFMKFEKRENREFIPTFELLNAINICLKKEYGNGDDEYRFVEDLKKELNIND